MSDRTVVRLGDEYGWTTIGGKPHYGTVSDFDSNVVYIKCRYCEKECCTDLQDDEVGGGDD